MNGRPLRVNVVDRAAVEVLVGLDELVPLVSSTVLNLSQTGLCVKSSIVPTVDQAVQVEVRAGFETVMLQGAVRWVQPQAMSEAYYGIAVQDFVSLSGERIWLEVLLDHLGRSAVSDNMTIRDYLTSPHPMTVPNETMLAMVLEHCRLKELYLNQYADETMQMTFHDLLNPLGVIEASNEMLRSGMLSVNQYVAENVPQMIALQCQKMKEFINDALDAHKLNYHHKIEQWEAIDLVVWLEGVLEAFRPLALSKRVRVVTEVALPKAAIHGDPVRLTRVLDNLLQNALKHSPAGGQIIVSLELADGSYRLQVRDFGPGIAKRILPRLFSPYATQQDVEKSIVAGHGIGMSIVKSFIEAHGGALEIVSQPNVGTTMIVWLPVLH